MGWFKQQYLSWMIASAAAVCVSCQQLNSTLHNGSHACRGEEVLFTCIIRGSQTLTTLILAWSSTEYIGQGDPLRFTTDNVPGTKRTSMVNENVIAILISNTNMDGIPVLVSELRIVADEPSTVTCRSVTTSSRMSTTFRVSDAPEAPLSVGAAEIFRSENECDIILKWDPPADSRDIDHYIVYIPSLNVDVKETSLISTIHLLRDCPESLDIKVAAVNRFGCIGINSTVRVHAQLTLQSTSPALPTSQSPESSTSQSSTSQSSTPESNAMYMSLFAIVGGASGGIIAFVVIIAIIIIVLMVILYSQLKKGYQRSRLLDKDTESVIETFQDLLYKLYVELRSPSDSPFNVQLQHAARELVSKMKSTDADKDYIQEAIMNILETIDLNYHAYFLKALKYTKDIIPDLSRISKPLEKMRNGLTQTLEGGNSSESMQRALEDLKDTIKGTPPGYIKKTLLKVCKKLDEELIERENEPSLRQKEQQEAQTDQTATATESEATMTNSNPGPMEGHNCIPMHPINLKLADGNTSYV